MHMFPSFVILPSREKGFLKQALHNVLNVQIQGWNRSCKHSPCLKIKWKFSIQIKRKKNNRKGNFLLWFCKLILEIGKNHKTQIQI